MHQQLDARGTGVGKEVAVMRLCAAEDPHHAGEQAFGAGAHVHGLDRQPHGIDADRRSTSRSQAAHSAAALVGQFTVTTVPLRLSSM